MCWVWQSCTQCNIAAIALVRHRVHIATPAVSEDPVLVHVTPTDRQTKTNSRGTETLFLALNLRLVQSFCSPRGNVSRHFSVQGVPEKERKQTKTSGRFPDLKNFSGTNVLMIRDSVWFFLLVETMKFRWKLSWWKLFWWKLIFFGGN
jgi:hypothetical protein